MIDTIVAVAAAVSCLSALTADAHTADALKTHCQ
jgi:hypothetical protein